MSLNPSSAIESLSLQLPVWKALSCWGGLYSITCSCPSHKWVESSVISVVTESEVAREARDQVLDIHISFL